MIRTWRACDIHDSATRHNHGIRTPDAIKGTAFHKKKFEQAYKELTDAGAGAHMYWNPTMKALTPASGDKRDYMTFVPYVLRRALAGAPCSARALA